ncbi:PAN domain-containing protein [Platanthera zijinensis]|uniref:PAN domain-containing protein n=1 Tax=Platanthera zijinensis TaxID=2320716 RepID=A0AAP0GGC1_9ASPA
MEKQKNLFAFLPLLIVYLCLESSPAAGQSQWLDVGFTADAEESGGQFQPLLSDPTGIFSMGFLRVNSSNLDIAVVHLPSSFPVWRASPSDSAEASSSASLSFNGSLIFSGIKTGVIWSTPVTAGDRVVLLNSSNLQILKLGETNSVLWQSFDFPANTIVQNQNFTSAAALFSPNQRYSMKLGSDYLALFMEFGRGIEEPMYWKRTALQSKNLIIAGDGPLYARVETPGFIGLYQKENAPVDVVPFDSFGRGIPGFRRLTLEDDGNVRGYYWNGTVWDSDYAAITGLCELPSPCGAYGLCNAETGRCGCLDNRSNGCFPSDSGDLCRSGDEFSVLRSKGVDLGNKEVLSFVKVGNYVECEQLCVKNCSCWAAVYNNGSGYCYPVNYPVQTVVAVGDEQKMGYFKLRSAKNDGGGGDKRKRTEKALLIVGVVAAAAVAGVGVYRLRCAGRWRRRRESLDGAAPGPYKDLNSGSFRSIELVDSFRK